MQVGSGAMAPGKRSGVLSVAVTGAAGYIGEHLVRLLCGNDRIERVAGFDIRRPSFTHEKFVHDDLDVRSPALEGRFAGIDCVVHLAFIMDPIKNEAEMRDVNVNGSQNVFRSAGRAGVSKIVHSSSATVYGAHPDNDVPLTEDSPLRANLDFSYAAHNLEVEYVVREFREEFPDVVVTVLRSPVVFGPNVNNAWSHVLEMPVLLGVRGYSPPFQLVHEDDVARAFEFAVIEDLVGPFNVAPRDWATSEELLTALGRRRRDVPEPAAFALWERMWSLGLSETPAGMLHYMMHPWVTSPARLEAAGFGCERSTVQTFAEVAVRAKDRVRLGRTSVRKGDLARGAVAGLGLVGAAVTVGAGRAARRRRTVVT